MAPTVTEAERWERHKQQRVPKTLSPEPLPDMSDSAGKGPSRDQENPYPDPFRV